VRLVPEDIVGTVKMGEPEISHLMLGMWFDLQNGAHQCARDRLKGWLECYFRVKFPDPETWE
jgi:hypothetical protein